MPFGLGAAAWTRDVRVAHRVAHGIRAGVVWVGLDDQPVRWYDDAAGTQRLN